MTYIVADFFFFFFYKGDENESNKPKIISATVFND